MKQLVLFLIATGCADPSASDRDGGSRVGGSDGGLSDVDGDRPAGPDGSRPRPDSGMDWRPPACDGAGLPASFCSIGDTGASVDVVLASGTHALLDCDADVRTLTIEAGACLTASRTQSATLTMHGNLVVRGLLDLGRPDDRIPAPVRTEIVFAGMNDEAYEGTPSTVFGSERGPPVATPIEVIDGDFGLWIVDSGVVTAAGVLKRAWSFLTSGVGPGAASFTVADASGWESGDLLVLTPSAERSARDHTEQFEEVRIASVSGTSVTLERAPTHTHAGCTDCFRRAEAIDLSRNVVIRSADDTAHAHIAVAHAGLLQLDSVELRWLGPEKRCDRVARRYPIHFHQQGDAADRSFVRHTSIWGGQHGFVQIEQSHGIEVTDVAGYDTYRSGFTLTYDTSACSTRCIVGDNPPRVLMTDVIAARVGVGVRSEGCVRIQHRLSGVNVVGGEGSGCIGCVATGVGVDGDGTDIAGFQWSEGGSGRPDDFTFREAVAHNNDGHGLFVWHNNTSREQPPYEAVRVWSNEGFGIHWGAYETAYRLLDFVAVDNGTESIGLKAIPRNDLPRMENATIDDLRVLAYVLVQTQPNVLRDLRFTGARPLAFTQIHDRCTGGDETDPMDGDCTRIWLRIEDPTFAAGVRPFDFGWSANRNSIWEVRGFRHPDAAYADLPADFDLYRRDNMVPGGRLDTRFDAWLVPR